MTIGMNTTLAELFRACDGLANKHGMLCGISLRPVIDGRAGGRAVFKKRSVVFEISPFQAECKKPESGDVL